MDTVPKSRSQGKYINKVAQCSWFKTSAYYRYPEICRWLLCLFSLWECLVLKFSLLSWSIFIEEDIGCFIMWLWLALPWHHSFIVRHWLVFLWLQFVLFVILVRYPAAPFVFPVLKFLSSFRLWLMWSEIQKKSGELISFIFPGHKKQFAATFMER